MKKISAVLLLAGLATILFGGYRMACPVDGILSLGWKEAWHPGAFIAGLGIFACMPWFASMLIRK